MMFYPMFYTKYAYHQTIANAENYEELNMIGRAIANTTTIPENEIIELLIEIRNKKFD